MSYETGLRAPAWHRTTDADLVERHVLQHLRHVHWVEANPELQLQVVAGLHRT